MKIFHKKFLNQDELLDNSQRDSVQDKSRLVYFLNQVLIWGIILIVFFFIYKFLMTNCS